MPGIRRGSNFSFFAALYCSCLGFYDLLTLLTKEGGNLGLCLCISLPLPIKEEFSLYQKLWDSLDYREKVNKSDTKYICVHSHFYYVAILFRHSDSDPYRVGARTMMVEQFQN